MHVTSGRCSDQGTMTIKRRRHGVKGVMRVRNGWEAILNIRGLVSIDGPVEFRLSLFPLAVEVYKCCPKVNQMTD